MLRVLADGGPLTTADLARAEHVTPQAMGALVAELEVVGLVRRTRDPGDGRRRPASITRAGRRTLGEAGSALLERVAGVIAAARAAGVPVIYVVVGFRPGYPEVSANNASFSVLLTDGCFTTTDPAGEVAAEIAPQEGDVVTLKHRVSAFAGSDLEMILRARGIDTLLLFGIATSGVVLSTVRQAADSDYRLVVVEDCCADRDAEVDRVLTEKVFPRQATVTSADAVTAVLRA